MNFIGNIEWVLIKSLHIYSRCDCWPSLHKKITWRNVQGVFINSNTCRQGGGEDWRLGRGGVKNCPKFHGNPLWMPPDVHITWKLRKWKLEFTSSRVFSHWKNFWQLELPNFESGCILSLLVIPLIVLLVKSSANLQIHYGSGAVEVELGYRSTVIAGAISESGIAEQC